MRSLPVLVPRLPAALLAALLAAFVALAPSARGAEDGPRIVFDRMEHDFGVVAQEQELTTEFTFRNEGNAPLEGIKTIGDCGCYGVTLSAPKLAPGATGTLKVVFRTLAFAGPLTKKITVKSNDPKTPDLTLKLQLLVAQGVVLDPGRVYFEVLLGETPSRSFVASWLDGVGRPFQVTGVEIPGTEHEFRVETSAYEEQKRLGTDADGKPREGTWKGTKITLTFAKPPPLGMHSWTALVRTDHPDYQRLTVPVTAAVSGRVWLQSRKVSFGWVPSGTPKKTTIAVRPYSKDVKLGALSAKSRKGRVQTALEKDPDPRNGPDAWRLVVSLPPDAPAGKIEDVVELATEVPGEEKVEVAVEGEVLPGR